MKNNLLSSISIPYAITKGSFELRQQKAEQFTHKIMGELSGQLDSKGVSLSKFGRNIKKLLPENLSIFVKKNTDPSSYAQLNRVYTKDNYIVQQSLELKPDENRKINILHLPTIAHEIRHLADSLYHPKFMAREQILAKKGLDSDKYTRFYDEDVYVKEQGYTKKLRKKIIKKVKQKTIKTLRGLSRKDKINILQNMRYNLISEKNAYKEGSKTAKKLYKKNQPVYEDSLENPSKEYMFDEKIKLFRDMSFELIRQERKVNKKYPNLTKQN